MGNQTNDGCCPLSCTLAPHNQMCAIDNLKQLRSLMERPGAIRQLIRLIEAEALWGTITDAKEGCKND